MRNETFDFWTADRARLRDELMISSDSGMAVLLAAASLVCFFALTLFTASAEGQTVKTNTANFRTWVRSELLEAARTALEPPAVAHPTLFSRRS